MADKSKIAHVAALAQGPGADEICVMKLPVIDDVGVAAHGTQLHHSALAEDFRVYTLVALKVEFILWIFRMPGIPPASSGLLAEA